MTDLRSKLAALFRRVTSPDVSDDDAFAALREFRSLGCTPREIDDALAANPSSIKQVSAASAQQPAPSPFVDAKPTPTFADPVIKFGKHGPKRVERGLQPLRLSEIAKCDPGWLTWWQGSDKPPTGWWAEQVKMALAGVKAAPQPAQAPAQPDADDDEPPF